MELSTDSNQHTPDETNQIPSGALLELEWLVETIDQADRVHEAGNLCRVIVAGLETGDVAIKVPRYAMVGNRILRESLVMTLAHENAATAPLKTPGLIGFQQKGTQYIAYDYVQGGQLDRAGLQRLSVEERCSIGRAVVDFALWLGESIPLDDHPELAMPLYTTPLRDRRFDQVRMNTLSRRGANDTSRQWSALEQATDLVLDSSGMPECVLVPTMLGHGDIRADNMVFTEKAGKVSLHGMIDFGIAEPSYMEYELRHLAQFGPEVVAAAAQQYRAHTGAILDEELLTWWSQVQYLAVTGYRWGQNLPLLPGDERAFEYLFPELDYNDRTPIPTGVY